MREYALITLNMIEYAGIYLKKQSADYTRILNVSDGVHSIRSLYKLLTSYRDRENCQTFKMERFAKRIMNECRCATRNFSGHWSFVELGHFDKHFVKNTRKKGPAWKIWEFFLLDTLKTIFWTENLTQRWMQSGFFFPKWGHFFRFSKRAGEASPLPFSCSSVSVAEYATISQNMPKYAWKCLNKLFWLCQGSESAWSSDMFHRRLKMPRVLNKPGLRITNCWE